MLQNGHLRPGVAHRHEPDTFDQGRAWEGDTWSGCTWEDLHDADDPVPTVGEFLESAHRIHGLDVREELAAWRAAGCPSARDDASAVVACVAKALRAGPDVYDSDTRTFIFAKGERVTCAGCPGCAGR